MNIKYKDLIHVLLPFIAQWADSTTRQGICLIIVLSQQLIIRIKLLLWLLQFWSRSQILLNVVHGQVKKTNKNMTKKSVGLRNHSTLITMFKCFFKWISSTRIWSKYCYPSLPSEQIARQGKAYAWSLYYHNNSDHDPETEKVQNNVQYIQMHSI